MVLLVAVLEACAGHLFPHAALLKKVFLLLLDKPLKHVCRLVN